jgi:hypothetical protein
LKIDVPTQNVMYDQATQPMNAITTPPMKATTAKPV